MTKKDFIALADAIRKSNKDDNITALMRPLFTWGHLEILADFCKRQNRRFDRKKWIGYIEGLNGPNGGKVK
jgi:hypothetical protein